MNMVDNIKNDFEIIKEDNKITIYEGKNLFGKYDRSITIDTEIKEIINYTYYKYNNGQLINSSSIPYKYKSIYGKSYILSSLNKDNIPDDNRTYEDFIKYIKD